jgi:hypothetical protein
VGHFCAKLEHGRDASAALLEQSSHRTLHILGHLGRLDWTTCFRSRAREPSRKLRRIGSS